MDTATGNKLRPLAPRRYAGVMRMRAADAHVPSDAWVTPLRTAWDRYGATQEVWWAVSDNACFRFLNLKT